MSYKNNISLFIVWKAFQRRVETLAPKLNCKIIYIHFPWEEGNPVKKILSYVLKIILTFYYLCKYRPKRIFVQLPPGVILYPVFLYCKLVGAYYISDCHNAMLYDSNWVKWPFMVSLLKNSHILLVHNEDVVKYAERLNLESAVLLDPFPDFSDLTLNNSILEKYGLNDKTYVIIPGGFGKDEPLEEIIKTVRDFPDIKFVMTWFPERMPKHLRNSIPPNLVLTGFLNNIDFITMYKNASAAIVLTTREGTQPSGASEAISLEVPLIISDLNTTRKLYRDAPVYVYNKHESISKGVEEALANKNLYKEKIKTLRLLNKGIIEKQLNNIREKLNI
jgi:hypothetical protein